MHPNDFAMARVKLAESTQVADIEASTLGLAPGSWPLTLEFGGFSYRRAEAIRHDGELAGFRYYRPGGQLTVWND